MKKFLAIAVLALSANTANAVVYEVTLFETAISFANGGAFTEITAYGGTSLDYAGGPTFVIEDLTWQIGDGTGGNPSQYIGTIDTYTAFFPTGLTGGNSTFAGQGCTDLISGGIGCSSNIVFNGSLGDPGTTVGNTDLEILSATQVRITMNDLDSFSGDYRMTLTAVPVPAAVWLFGSALGLMGFIRRRKA